VVTQVRTPANDGYTAVQLAFGAIDPRKVNKPETGHFAKAGATPRRHLVELRTSDAAEYTVGQEITASVFDAGALVDVVGTSKGKGTAGVMKRHGFAGLGASHGTLRHPRPGLQGRPDGRPHGQRPRDHPEPHRAPGRRRARAAAHQGCGPRSPWRSGAGQVRCQEGRCAVSTTVEVKNADGTPAGDTVELPDHVFDVPANIPLMHQVVVGQLAAARQGTHSTKTRGDVRGGGKKPYRQKGTGRARQGSLRAPQFTGGGVVHGPVPRDYSQKTPKKMKAAALRGALSDRARSAAVQVVTSVVAGDTPSTKAARRVVDALLAGVEGTGERTRVLAVIERDDRVGELSLRNLPQVHLLWPDQLNTYDVLHSDVVLFTSAALETFLAGPVAAETRRSRAAAKETAVKEASR
jgi:large subunit ribosomal protein L4